MNAKRTQSRLPQGSAYPSPPAPPFFDPLQEAWVLSRYGDVAAALREPALLLSGPQKSPPHLRSDVANTLSRSEASAWQQQIDTLARRIITELPPDRPVDLVSEVLRPWSAAVAAVVLGFDTSATRKLDALMPYIFSGDAELAAQRGPLRRVRVAVQRRIANARLKGILRRSGVPGAQSLFVSLSQTVSHFLANAWLALLENPSQLARLRAEPHLMPRAIEELLRYCGTVHTLLRKADKAVEVAGIKIARGESVLLKVASANRDPEQFSDPNTLDIGRRGAGHLGLGAGPHSCIGALLVRMTATSAIRAFVDELEAVELVEPVTWRRGSVDTSPRSLSVRYTLTERSYQAKIALQR
jgi:cytochrome P450